MAVEEKRGRREITKTAVIEAINECRALGPAKFREKYGFGSALGYILHYDDEEFDSKAFILPEPLFQVIAHLTN